ncbi:hypothetical protein [Synechococcus sp. PCC 7336]|uniref:hypothetical protein n=1 Tax=Synechococcus sp. PCC 7336 TaxID=195250 RepID=UPI00035CC88E|nr:hypothetical protein [Synechococcus sp. PCC 7336]
MLILSRQDVELLKMKQPQSQLVLFRYRRRVFRRTSQFGDIQAAIAACREGLDSGRFCVVLQDGFKGQEVWQALGQDELKALKA